jgi:hypothetical protein
MFIYFLQMKDSFKLAYDLNKDMHILQHLKITTSLLEKIYIINYCYLTIMHPQFCLRNAKSTSLKIAAPF